MVTLVGTQTNFADSIRELLELDFAAVEAYDAAINRLETEDYKSHLKGFKSDHGRHIKELSDLLRKHREEVPQDLSSTKQWLTQGKVFLANLIGDDTILRAMLSNECDTNTAYERMNERNDIWSDALETLRRGLDDERRHKQWLENTLELNTDFLDSDFDE
jgi:rubrerythrin